MAKAITYLVKDNDDLCCHCHCQDALITFPPQMDCPWCGCGWLFTCMTCRKAFAFARGMQVQRTWEQLAYRDLEGRWDRPPEDDDVTQWIAAMQELLAHVEAGKQYVCFDGLFLPTDVKSVQFEGWHAKHDLDFVPHVAALDDYFVMEDVLSNEDYWQANSIRGDNDGS